MNKILIFSILLLLFSCNDPSKVQDTTLLLDELTPQIDSLLQVNNLTGLSVAVIEDAKILWHQEYGYKENGKEEKMDENTAYSTASISKAITATTCLILAEAGKIDIDAPVSNYLKRWQLPASEYLQKTDLTIRHLLSHTGGTSHGGYADFYGNDSIPTIIQCLNGELLPRTNAPITIQFEPGTDVLYSGGGFVIVQLALEDALDQPFQDIVAETIFAPLEMEHTTMIQPNQAGFLTNVAKVHNVNQEVIRTGIPICPQLGPSGTWSTAKDLARFGIAIQKALNGQPTEVISTQVAKQLSEIGTYKFAGGGALGWQRSYAFGNLDWLTIMGQNTGVGGELNVTMEGGKGIVMLANGETKNRLPVLSFMRSQIIERLNWRQEINEKAVALEEAFVDKIKGSYLDFMYGDFGETVSIQKENGQLYITSQLLRLLTDSEKNKMIHIGNRVFKIENYPNYVAFVENDERIDSIKIYRYPNEAEENKWTIPIEALKTVKVQLIDAFSGADFEQSKQLYRAIQERETDYDFSYSLIELGVMFYGRAEIEKTVAMFEFNASENPDNPDSYAALAEIHERVGNNNEALKYYQLLLPMLDDEKDKQAIKAKIETLR
ncbi:MAG: serine hydrolase [Saprospiraceae bacterium]